MSGPDAGRKLTPVNAGIGYWFGFSSSFPGIGIHGHLDSDPSATPDFQSIQPDQSSICTCAEIDMIHALDNPAFVTPEEAEAQADGYLSNQDRVIGVYINGEAKAYPHDILNYHEVINDVIGEEEVTVSYCPLTGTAKVWKRNAQFGNFGVSGQLYNSNLLLFDRETNSRWWQIGGMSIKGDRRGVSASILPHIETTWEEWSSKYPNTKVVSAQTGYHYLYDLYPYGSYAEDHQEILVPVDKFSENLIRAKDKVFTVIIGTTAKAYLPEDFM